MRSINGIYGLLTAAALTVGCSATPTEPQNLERIPAPAEPLLRLVVTPSLASLRAGETLKLAAAARSDDRSTVRQVAVTWVSSNGLIATVSSAGEVRGIAPGQADIRAQWGTNQATARVTVLKAGPPEVGCLSVIPKKGGCQ